MTRTFLIDLDGTLVDSLPDIVASCNRLMAKLGLAPFAAADIRPMIGDGAAALVDKIMTARGRAATTADVDALVASYMDHDEGAARAYPGVPETLDELLASGWRLAVCTNKPAAPARAVLKALGLLHRFAAVGGGDSFPVRKPDPGHLLATLKDAGGDPAGAVMLGDHRNDIAAAAAAGIPSIFAAWGYGAPGMADGAGAIAHAFTQAPGLADRLLAR